MMRLIGIAALACAAVVWAVPGAAPPAAGVALADVSLAVRVAGPPTITMGTDGRRHLVYEFLVSNRSPSGVRLDRLVVRDGHGRRLAVHRGAALADLAVRVDGAARTPTLPAGMSAIVLIDVAIAAQGPMPELLTTHLAAIRDDGAGRLVATATARVDRRPPLRIGPPLRGDDLMVIGCCGRPFAHRAAAEPRDGTTNDVVFGQRYAIDLLGLDAGLATSAGDPARNESYFIHGAEVLAVAPGRIVAVRDGVPENTPPGAPGAGAPDDLARNRVVQDLGDGRFALYAHLQPGSIPVAPGDAVEPGDALGRVGNTGNSSEPHLHFHVMDGPGGTSGVAADGLPYVLDRVRLDSRVTGLADDPPAPARIPVDPPNARAERFPLTGDVLDLE